MSETDTVSTRSAWRAVGRSMVRFVALAASGWIHQPRERVGERLAFANGTSAVIYRETVVDTVGHDVPAVLVVEFRLRAVHGWLHWLFRLESILNTPLFVGFPGFASKLWLAHDEHEVYRGIYEWDGAERAVSYAEALSKILALVCVPGSVEFHVLPDHERDAWLSDRKGLPANEYHEPRAWWLVA
ncbi:hypothetical protein [Antrihabitans stalactiti]|uniref:Uncharacterized protein n=1 Tax=Antrihabitans stalactiti TaxID=2584121 RepID=A0A848KD44_9NOCA|nr:hypothetical protein [Antrihabitans stalactiti]NMN93957.1 hypothetical protein [Antrihabitans stalactiti]